MPIIVKTISIFIASLFAITIPKLFGQKFMIKEKDSLPYEAEITIQKDTFYGLQKTYYPGDTMFSYPCESFEKINGRVINYVDINCHRQGLWTIYDTIGNYCTGKYLNNEKVGLWKYYNKNKKLIKEIEDVYLDDNAYRVIENDYSNGRKNIVIYKPLLSFWIKNDIFILIVMFGCFFFRVFINSIIYNNENDISPVTITNDRILLYLFTLWFFKFKPENKTFVIISNSLSFIAITLFIVTVTLLSYV